MAKLKIRGFQELIDVNEEDAKRFVAQKNSGQISPEDNVSIGIFSGEARQIVAVLLDSRRETDNDFSKKAREIQEEKQKFLKLSVEEKTQRMRPVFKLFYSSATGQDPEEEVVEEALKDTEAFFVFNDKRIFIDLNIWVKRIPPECKFFPNAYYKRAFDALTNCMATDKIESEDVLFNRL